MTPEPIKFRKKPVVIEAMFFNGHNGEMVAEWCGGVLYAPTNGNYALAPPTITIETLEGKMRADAGDWIIREPFPTDDRQFYPCKPDIFAATYEGVES